MRLGHLLACAIVFGGLGRPANAMAYAPTDFPAEAYEFFEQRVRPLLVERCYECHSSVSGKNRGGLVLDSRLAILTGGDNGPAVVPGEPETSLLVAAIRYESELAKMSPTGKLSDDEIAILVHWIKLGAPADDAAAAAARHEIDFESGRDFWSFQPLACIPLPAISSPPWPRTRVDRFILASLDGLSLAPSEPADRRTLVRRIYFDLVGLPPTPDEVERFVADERPDAYERLVDRLLASPHYGERWGRYWLDLVRYVDATASWLNDLSTGEYQGTYLNTTNLEPEKLVPYLRNPRLDREHQRRQLDLLARLNEEHLHSRGPDAALEARLAAMESAFRMQFAASDALNVGLESETVRAEYGEGEFARACLLARRLAERGVRFTQIYYGNGQPWDTHTNHNELVRKLASDIDQPIAALLNDLKRRGMLDETLVIWGGEFGRTPTTEGGDGRDHNHYGFTMWLAGGGVRGGMAYGATDDFGFQAVRDRVHVHDIHATILHQLGLDHEKLTYLYDGRDFRLTDVYGRVVREILA